MSNPLNLTFGVELECIICFDPALFQPALHDADGVLWEQEISSKLHTETKLRIIFREHIANFLRAKGFRTYKGTARGGNQKWTVTNEYSIEINDGPRSEDGFLECDVEIKSPALLFCPEGLRRVQHMVQLLTKNFDVFVNDSCGLHVHIGNRKKGFPLETLKHFSILTAIFEHQLDTLHPAHRIGNPHARGASALFKGQHPWGIVRRIQGCETKADLVLLYADNEDHPDRCFAYNLCPMLFGRNRTIEFRQHKGTLEWPEIVDWVQLAGGMVNAMHQISAVGLAQLISTCAFDPKFTVFDLMLRLKLEALVDYYSGHLHTHRRPGPIWICDGIRGDAEAVPRVRLGLERWDELERRHKLERLEETERRKELDRRHELERRRVLEKQDDGADARRTISGFEGEE